jgi:hypothetical protein
MDLPLKYDISGPKGRSKHAFLLEKRGTFTESFQTSSSLGKSIQNSDFYFSMRGMDHPARKSTLTWTGSVFVRLRKGEGRPKHDLVNPYPDAKDRKMILPAGYLPPMELLTEIRGYYAPIHDLEFPKSGEPRVILHPGMHKTRQVSQIVNNNTIGKVDITTGLIQNVPFDDFIELNYAEWGSMISEPGLWPIARFANVATNLHHLVIANMGPFNSLRISYAVPENGENIRQV